MKLYRYDGTLDEVTFIEENKAAPECTQTTFVCIDSNGVKFRCSKDMYTPSRKEAYQRYLNQCEEALPQLIKARKDIEENISYCRSEIQKLKELIEYVK